MDCYIATLILLASLVVTTTAWSRPFYPVHRGPPRITRFAPLPPSHKLPIRFAQPQVEDPEEPKWERPKRDYEYEEHDHETKPTNGVTGPVHTFVKTDKNANYKWGVRHHVGNKYAS